jgi:hypothetical protein
LGFGSSLKFSNDRSNALVNSGWKMNIDISQNRRFKNRPDIFGAGI